MLVKIGLLAFIFCMIVLGYVKTLKLINAKTKRDPESVWNYDTKSKQIIIRTLNGGLIFIKKVASLKSAKYRMRRYMARYIGKN